MGRFFKRVKEVIEGWKIPEEKNQHFWDRFFREPEIEDAIFDALKDCRDYARLLGEISRELASELSKPIEEQSKEKIIMLDRKQWQAVDYLRMKQERLKRLAEMKHDQIIARGHSS